MKTRRAFRISTAMLDDMPVQKLKPKEFSRLFEAALRGESNLLSRFIQPLSVDLPEDWAVRRAAVFQRDNYTCSYCGAHGGPLECDHRIPRSRGGSHDLSNLTTACKPCNRRKRNRTVDEFMGVI